MNTNPSTTKRIPTDAIQHQLNLLAQARSSNTVLLAAVNLELDLLAPLYEVLVELPDDRPLDIIFYCRGGIVNAARRIALLFREFSNDIRFLIPHYCESAGTIIALSGNQIITGPLAVFSPIDPILHAADTEQGPSAMSVQDIRLFQRVIQDWFGLPPEQAQQQALTTLCSSIFPATLTAFHRCTLELESICHELLNYALPHEPLLINTITQQLIYGYHSHSYAITAQELAALGLPAIPANAKLSQQLWAIAGNLRLQLGAGNRSDAEAVWYDSLMVSTQTYRYRERLPGGLLRWVQPAMTREEQRA